MLMQVSIEEQISEQQIADEQLIEAKIAEIAATADQYPSVVIIHHVPTQTVRYMSPWGLELLDTTLEALRALGPAYSVTHFNSAESEQYTEKAFRLVMEEAEPKVHTLYQQVRTNERKEWSMYLTAFRRLLSNAQGEPLLLIALAVPLHPDNHFAAKVQRLIDENDFLRQHRARFATLTARERQVLSHLARGLSSAEVAAACAISAQTADTHRRNIRRKLGQLTSYELGQYARAFDLI